MTSRKTVIMTLDKTFLLENDSAQNTQTGGTFLSFQYRKDPRAYTKPTRGVELIKSSIRKLFKTSFFAREIDTRGPKSNFPIFFFSTKGANQNLTTAESILIVH